MGFPSNSSEVIGLIPAAGQGTRIGHLPCSKEIVPLGFVPSSENSGVQPKVCCQYLLEKMGKAGIKKIFIVLGEQKWDIPNYFRDGDTFDVHIAYLICDVPFGVPFTLDQAYPFIQDSLVALGWPDLFFNGHAEYGKLIDCQVETEADVVLGLFPADRPEKVDMVDLDTNDRLRQIVIKPQNTDLQYTWGMAVWSPRFSEFMHHFVLSAQETATEKPEIFVGDVIRDALRKGLKVEVVHVSDKPYIDIGTPEDLERVARTLILP